MIALDTPAVAAKNQAADCRLASVNSLAAASYPQLDVLSRRTPLLQSLSGLGCSMLCLSNREVRALTSFIEAVSSPLNFPDSTTWRREVSSRGRNLLDAPRSVFTLEWDGTSPIEHEGLDPGAVPAYTAYYHALDPGHEERRRRRRVVFSYSQELDEGWEVGPEEFRHDFLARYRLDRGASMAHDVSRDVAGWCGFYPDSEPRERFDKRVVPILKLAYPAFRAGLATLFRTGRLRNELVRLLDTISDGFLLVGVDGCVLHQNLALARIRRTDPEWNRVEQVLNATLLLFRTETLDVDNTAGLFRTVSVRTQRATYEVIPTIPGPDLTQLGVQLLVQVLTRSSVIPSREILTDRFGLTSREAEVMRCLVQGMAYKRVAEHLGISIDTVRSHIRNIYSKLEVHSVTEAVSRTLREAV
jgi:DNA-binding CsgD family transcriptional regulator